jgi:hypothetical protein
MAIRPARVPGRAGPVIWRSGQETLAVAIAISGGVCVAMGLCRTPPRPPWSGWPTATSPRLSSPLISCRATPPIVWTITALVAVLSLAIHRTSLVWRWLGVVGLVAAAIFLLGSIFSVLGRTPQGSSSLVGVGLFILWMLVLSGGLWRTASRSIDPRL